MKRRPHRQGDILFVPIDEIPENTKAHPHNERGRIVLAEGETTGHAHCILDDSATLFVTDDLNDLADRFLKIEQDLAVVHEEHRPVNLERGAWAIRPKREYQPEAPRRIAD